MSERTSENSNEDARNNSRLHQKLTVAVVSGAMAIGAMWASQEMSTEYQKDVMDCVERVDDVEQCVGLDAEVDTGSDHSGIVEFAAYGLALLSAVSLLSARREAE